MTSMMLPTRRFPRVRSGPLRFANPEKAAAAISAHIYGYLARMPTVRRADYGFVPRWTNALALRPLVES